MRIITIRVDELRKYEHGSNAKRKGWIYIFEHELNVIHILANDFGKLSCVIN